MLYGKPAPPPKYEDLEQPPKYEDLGPEFGAGPAAGAAAAATAVVNVETETAAASATALPTIPQVRSDCQNGAANK